MKQNDLKVSCQLIRKLSHEIEFKDINQPKYPLIYGHLWAIVGILRKR